MNRSKSLIWIIITVASIALVACDAPAPATTDVAEPAPSLQPPVSSLQSPAANLQLSIDNPIIFVRQTPLDYTFNTIADIFGNFYSFGDAYADEADCEVGEYFGMPTGGNLYRLDPDGTLTNLTQLEDGAVRDPEISYDGEWIVFSMKTGPCDTWQIYEIRVDGTQMRRISDDADINDLDPSFLPDGFIIFTSDRLRWADGYENLPSAQLFIMDGDGRGVRLLSGHPHGIFNPLVSSDGMIYFTQWDFHDLRTRIDEDTNELAVNRFLMWKIHIDGSREGHPAFGQHLVPDFSGGLTNIREMPARQGTFVATLTNDFSTFGSGSLLTISPDPDFNFDNDEMRFITPDVFQNYEADSPRYRDPFPLANGNIVAAHAPDKIFCADEPCRAGPPEFSLVVLKEDGSAQTTIFDDISLWNLQPVEVAPHTAYALAAGSGNAQFSYGIINSMDVYNRGINCDEVENGDCQPSLEAGSAQTVRLFTLRRDANMYSEFVDYKEPTDEFLGDVPVHSDGSFAAVVPANTSIIWQVLDADGDILVQERFISEIAPGEVRTCTGCHSPHDGARGQTSNRALSTPTNLSGQDVDLDGNGRVDLLDLILNTSGN